MLKNAGFRRTWYISSGKNVGKATLKAPFPKNPELRLWTGKIPKTELDDLILATDIRLSPQGYLDKDSTDIASKLAIGHLATQTVEDEKAYKESMQNSQAAKANKCLAHKRRVIVSDALLQTSREKRKRRTQNSQKSKSTSTP